MRRAELAIVTAAALAAAATAMAQETVTYKYDARGRLVEVVRNGSVNANVTTNYSYDDADNRKTKTTTGAPK